MRSTTLFGIYAAVIVGLLVGLAGITLYSLEKSRWWDARTQLAHESYGLHQRLEANLYRLFKQQGDALLLGDRNVGEDESVLQAKIAKNISDIRSVIAREIQMVGEEEIEELELLDELEEEIASVNRAIRNLTAAGDPVAVLVQGEQLAALLDGDIDIRLDRKIEAALAEEMEETQEVIAEAEAFRARNKRLVYAIVGAGVLALLVGLVSFNTQIRLPIIRLQQSIEGLRNSEYAAPVTLGGSREFRDLGTVLNHMGEGLAAREASREEQKTQLEETVATRTAELKQLVDKLEIGEENRKQLMADISHELRTPLAIILGEADVTLRTSSDLNPQVSDSLARIRDSAKHTNQIVDDMLTVARFEAGQLRLDRKETDVRKIIHDAVAMFPGEVQTNLPGLPVLASVDEVRLRQSALALLQNARRYGGPTVMVELHNDDSAILITVEDDGPGLSAAEKNQAFDRFYRGSNVSGQGIEGSGLGLPVVKSVAEAHGGTVTLEDRDAGGLRVVIRLPKTPRMKVVSPDGMRRSA